MPQNRAEVAGGVLVASPLLDTRHQMAVTRLAYWLDERLTELAAFAGVELLLAEEPLTIRVPDVLVDGEYENFGEHTGKVSLDFDGTPLTLDLDALTTRHAQRP
ncbi:hypothetical protein B0293_09265 [Amycolatopsis azurea DSM 43854]|nr:hypothetical protein B0293_09265 [Amycolatopsis azurea DSM 43854]